jgi:hypothetical protein
MRMSEVALILSPCRRETGTNADCPAQIPEATSKPHAAGFEHKRQAVDAEADLTQWADFM